MSVDQFKNEFSFSFRIIYQMSNNQPDIMYLIVICFLSKKIFYVHRGIFSFSLGVKKL